jgi:hypothetical protein
MRGQLKQSGSTWACGLARTPTGWKDSLVDKAGPVGPKPNKSSCGEVGGPPQRVSVSDGRSHLAPLPAGRQGTCSSVCLGPRYQLHFFFQNPAPGTATGVTSGYQQYSGFGTQFPQILPGKLDGTNQVTKEGPYWQPNWSQLLKSYS